MIIEVSLPHFTEGKLKDKALNEQVRDEAGTRIRKETGSCYFPSSQVSAYFSNMVSYRKSLSIRVTHFLLGDGESRAKKN